MFQTSCRYFCNRIYFLCPFTFLVGKISYSGRSKYSARPNRRQYQSKKTKLFKNFFYKRKKMVNLAADSWTKYCNSKLKSRKDSCPEKLVLFFAEISPAIFFGGSEFLSTLKPNSERSLGPRPTFPFPGYVIGNIFWENSSESPNYAPRDVPRVQKIKCVLVSLQKSTLRIKIQCKFFLWRYMNAFPLEKKIAKIYFGFWYISFRLQKTEWSFKATHEQ